MALPGPMLPGPKKPTWGCPSCGTASNWAGTVKCRCGQDAPTSVIQRARKAAKAEMQQLASAPPELPAPWSEQFKQMQKQMENLTTELKRFKAAQGSAAPETADEKPKDPT
eukprot:641283-Pyramimonas_sp.AAC.1